MTVWIVLRETVRHSDIDSVWATEKTARDHADGLSVRGIGTVIEPYDVQPR